MTCQPQRVSRLRRKELTLLTSLNAVVLLALVAMVYKRRSIENSIDVEKTTLVKNAAPVKVEKAAAAAPAAPRRLGYEQHPELWEPPNFVKVRKWVESDKKKVFITVKEKSERREKMKDILFGRMMEIKNKQKLRKAKGHGAVHPSYFGLTVENSTGEGDVQMAGLDMDEEVQRWRVESVEGVAEGGRRRRSINKTEVKEFNEMMVMYSELRKHNTPQQFFYLDDKKRKKVKRARKNLAEMEEMLPDDPIRRRRAMQITESDDDDGTGFTAKKASWKQYRAKGRDFASKRDVEIKIDIDELKADREQLMRLTGPTGTPPESFAEQLRNEIQNFIHESKLKASKESSGFNVHAAIFQNVVSIPTVALSSVCISSGITFAVLRFYRGSSTAGEDPLLS